MPDYILTQLCEKVISSFGVDKDGAMRSDGMNVAVVVYDTQTQEAYFSGAQRPAIIVKNNELIEVKGDKMPIGRYVKAGEFTRTKLDVYSSLPMAEQAAQLSKYIFNYKGNNLQTDDIALIAFKI